MYQPTTPTTSCIVMTAWGRFLLEKNCLKTRLFGPKENLTIGFVLVQVITPSTNGALLAMESQMDEAVHQTLHMT